MEANIIDIMSRTLKVARLAKRWIYRTLSSNENNDIIKVTNEIVRHSVILRLFIHATVVKNGRFQRMNVWFKMNNQPRETIQASRVKHRPE